MPWLLPIVKIPLDLQAGVIVLEVILKGKRNPRIIKMVLDTGASMTTIPTEIALGIGCDPSKPHRRIEMITASGMEYVPVVVIPRVEVLGFSIKNLEAACLDLPPKSLVSGLLGLNFLKYFDILLRFKSKILEIV